MAASDILQDPYLSNLDLKTSGNINLYKKAITGLSESDRYNLISSKCTDFYQELEDSVVTFGFNTAVQVVTERDPGNVPTDFKKIIHSYNSIT